MVSGKYRNSKLIQCGFLQVSLRFFLTFTHRSGKLAFTRDKLYIDLRCVYTLWRSSVPPLLLQFQVFVWFSDAAEWNQGKVLQNQEVAVIHLCIFSFFCTEAVSTATVYNLLWFCIYVNHCATEWGVEIKDQYLCKYCECISKLSIQNSEPSTMAHFYFYTRIFIQLAQTFVKFSVV